MRARDWGAFLALTLVWGASFLWIKIAVREVGPFTLVAFRLTFALIGLCALVPLFKLAIPRDRSTWLALVVLGILNSLIPWTLISWAEQTIDSAIATVLNGTVPLFTIIIAHVFLRDDRMTVARVVGLFVGFAGVFVLAQRGGGETAADSEMNRGLLGQGAMLLAALSYAMSSVHSRRRLRHVSPFMQSLVPVATTTVLSWVVLFVVREPFVVPTQVKTWVAIVYLGVFAAGVASIIFFYLLQSVGPTKASLVTYTIPVVGVALGVIVLGELLDLPLVVGTALIVSGVWVVNRV